MAPLNAIVHSAESRPLPSGVQSWLGTAGLTVLRVDDADEVVETTLRGRPRLILMDGRGSCESAALALLKRIKGDAAGGGADVANAIHFQADIDRIMTRAGVKER